MLILVLVTVVSSKTGMTHPQIKQLSYFRTRNLFLFSPLALESFSDYTLDPFCTGVLLFTLWLLAHSDSGGGEKGGC